MKNKLLIAGVIVILLGGAISICAKQTNEPEQEQAVTTEADDFEPTPLVIETKEWEPQGVFYGTIVINGQGIEETGYEGMMFITMDGEYIRITCTDAVRSRFGDEF